MTASATVSSSGVEVVLVRPQHDGNIGSAARAMANMGLRRLHLVEPAATLGPDARAFAVGATDILEGVERHASLADALAPFSRAVGTTSGRNRQLRQTCVTARELPSWLKRHSTPGERIALVFGPESSGLENDELARLDPLVSIPCAAEQPTLNLAQAVLLVGYELMAYTEPEETPLRETAAAPIGEVEGLLGHVEEVLGRVGFDRDDTYHSVVRDLRQLAARARPNEREVKILRGVCRRTLHALEASDRR